MRRKQQQHTKGFTLVELMIVLAAAGILLATSFTVLNQAVPRMRLRQAARDVAGAIRSARLGAILAKDDVMMPFDVAGGRYVVVLRSAPGMVESAVVDGELRRVVSLPKGVSYVNPGGSFDGTDVLTLRPTSGAFPAAKFNKKGQLESVNIPGYVYLGDAVRDNYTRVGVLTNGNIDIETWKDGEWQ